MHRRISSAAATTLDVDADPIHVRQSLSSQPLRRILIRCKGLKEFAEALAIPSYAEQLRTSWASQRSPR